MWLLRMLRHGHALNGVSAEVMARSSRHEARQRVVGWYELVASTRLTQKPQLLHLPCLITQAQIFLRFGTPALRPFPAALGPWLQSIAVSTEFFHLLLSTLMVGLSSCWYCTWRWPLW